MTRRADAFARAQRRRMPPAELKLWSRLRNGRLGYKFRRQHPIDRYYADFACIAVRLVVECDGEQHGWDRTHDAERDETIEQVGWDVLRLPNALVLHHTEDALAAIHARCLELALATKHDAGG